MPLWSLFRPGITQSEITWRSTTDRSSRAGKSDAPMAKSPAASEPVAFCGTTAGKRLDPVWNLMSDAVPHDRRKSPRGLIFLNRASESGIAPG